MVNPFKVPTSNPEVLISKEFSLIISIYLASYFLTLLILSSKAFCTYLSVTIFDFDSLAHVAASPTTCIKSSKRVETL